MCRCRALPSLRSKIFAVAATLVLLSQVGTVMMVLVTANRDVTARAELALQSAQRIHQRTSDMRARQIGSTVKALAADFGFKRALATGETETLSSALSNHAARAGTEIALLLDSQGNIMALSEGTGIDSSNELRLVESVKKNGVGRVPLVLEDTVYEFFTTPVNAPLPVAWIAMGFAVDERYVGELEALTGLNVLGVAKSAAGLLPIIARPDEALHSHMGAIPATAARAEVTRIEFDREEHLVIASPLIPGSDDLMVVFSQSVAEAMAPYAILRTAALALGAVPLLLALCGALFLSRALTRPVQALVAAADRLRVGDYSQPVELQGADELAQLADTFNSMQADIARREKRITYQATHDSLTDLPNRDFILARLNDHISHDIGHRKPMSVMVIKLNTLTETSESLGHDIADAYVFQAATMIAAQLGPRDFLGRIEGDSFLLIAPSNDVAQSRAFANRICHALKTGISLHDVKISVRPVVGIAMYPADGHAQDQLLLRATIACGSGDLGGESVRPYQPGDEERRVRKTTILTDLRSAIRDEQLMLCYQPKLSLESGKIIGAEALVRWEHPSLGALAPAEFIPLAEQSGNISSLTRWVLRKAISDCQCWQNQGYDLAVSVNVSANDLLDQDLPNYIQELFNTHGLEPRNFVAEVTEEAVVRDLDQAVAVLEKLRHMGVKISIDDFGTGYSSLAQIRELPVDELKIDRSFVMRLLDSRDDTAIVRACIELAHELELSVVAEGVEEEKVLSWLIQQGAEQAQGYLISRPLPAEAFIAWQKRFQAAPAATGSWLARA